MTRRRPRPRPAEERLRHLLVMLPWLMERESVPVDEVADRFDLTPEEVAADLELVSMCGLPPYVDELIDVFIDEGTVHVGVPRLFTRSLRLNSVEAFDLVSAGRVAMEMSGADPDGPLARGLAKVEALVTLDLAATADATDAAADRRGGDRAGDGIDAGVAVDLERPDIAEVLTDAARRHERTRITYWSASADETTERTIVPLQIFADRGNWYVVADDDRSGARRTFRLDRITDIVGTGTFADPSDEPLPRPGEWFVDADVERVTLRLDPTARWVVERYPVDRVSEGTNGGTSDGTNGASGSITVVLPVTSRRWLERLLVRLGPAAEVIEPAALRSLGADAAARVLEVYRREPRLDGAADEPRS